MRQSRRTLAEIPQKRFEGVFWTVAMCDKDWVVFCGLPQKAHLRLRAIIEQFCECGDANLPPGWLRWVTPDVGDPPGAEMGAIEACGVVLHGRRASSGAASTFFVTEIVVDGPPATPTRRARQNADERQGFLPLGPNVSTKRR